jgi:WD40 repeat protein
MYVEAICPLCLHTHILRADMRGEPYRCEECEELFIINRKSKRTDKRPPRPRKVRAADDMDEVTGVDEAEVLPLANESPSRRNRRAYDDDRDDRPRPSPRRPRRGGPRWGLIVGLGLGAVVLASAAGVGTWWFLHNRDGDGKNAAHSGSGFPEVARGDPRVDVGPPKDTGTKPKQDTAKAAPKPDPSAWKVRADRPVEALKLPPDFKKEIPGHAKNTEVVFPTVAGSPFVAVGDNFDDKDERQVWNLQTGVMTGKLVGRRYSAAPPVLSPDGAHLAILPFGEQKLVDVAALASGKSVRIDTEIPVEVVDFAGPGKLLVAGKQGTRLHLRIWDATTGKREHDFDGPALGTPPSLTRDMLAVSPGGAYLAVVTPSDLSVWDLKAGTSAGRRELPWNAENWLLPCRGLSFSPDGSELAGFFQVKGQSRLVCWDVTRGESVFDVTFPTPKLWSGTEMAYKGHVLGWVGERRGWLLYGQMFLDRKADKVGAAPAGLLAPDQPYRHMVGPDHVATLAGGRAANKVLTVSRFDADKPGGN